MFGGMAMRMAYALQLHREVEYDPLGRKEDKASELSPTDREIRRRTMWACFLMDRFNSSGTERPSIAIESHIKVQLPIKESSFQMEITGPTEDLHGAVPNPIAHGLGQVSDAKANMGVAAYLIKIIALWGRVVRYLNLGGKEEDPHPLWHADSVFMGLKRQVQDFAANLPEKLRYTPEALQAFAAEKLGNQFLYLHISYYQTILFLHKFAIPTAPGMKLPAELPRDFTTQSAKIAVDAASKISSLMNPALSNLLVAPFAGYCAFASSTVHVWGIFSSNTQLEATSKRDLTLNVKYLTHMKKHWGMFHHMVENLKSIYRQFADWALQGPNANAAGELDAASFQYGDWFNKYPHGVSGTDYQDPAIHEQEESSNAALSQKSDLQSVEEFFHASQLPSSQQRKVPRRLAFGSSKSTANGKQSTIPKLKTEVASAYNSGTIRHQSQQAREGQASGTGAHQSMQPPLSTSNYTLFGPAFFQEVGDAGTSVYASGQHFPVTELDRHLVLGAYAQDMASTPISQRMPAGFAQQQIPTQDPSNEHTHLGNQRPDVSMNQLLWNQGPEYGVSPVGGAAYAEGLQSSAWFMPFNLVPPDVSTGDENTKYGHGLADVDRVQTFDPSHTGGQ